MTESEKAKAYDEALEKGRIFRDHLLETGDKGIAGEIEYIFPELAESENERIRKALLTFFQRFPYDSIENVGTNVIEALAWLEKQGEKKPTEVRTIGYWHVEDAEHTQSVAIDDELAGKMAEEYRNFRENCGVNDPVMLNEIEEAYYEGAISRKSATWSDEDEHRVEDTIYYLDTAKKHYACTIELDACIDCLKSLKDRIGG